MTRMENKRPKAFKNDVQLTWEKEIMHRLQNISRNCPEYLRSGETMKKTQSQEDQLKAELMGRSTKQNQSIQEKKPVENGSK